MRPTIAGPLAAALLFAALAALAGCDYPEPYFQQFQSRFAWTEERAVSAGWIPARGIPPEPVYCYRTLADADCYPVAEPAREHPRLIGMFERTGY